MIKPLDPNSPKGTQIARDLTRVLAAARIDIEARERANTKPTGSA